MTTTDEQPFTITSALPHPAGMIVDMGQAGKSPSLPAHCEITGIMQQRTGPDGQSYAIRFAMRLPVDWNRRFFFQGGGGSNGVVGNALGMNGPGNPPALMAGYAVVSQDSGHDNAINNDPARGGELSFGFDAQARANYGHASLKLVYDAAQAILQRYYGAAPDHRYFFGCSKGGQEGMAFAQRYPDAFDGIVAEAPGFSLPRAALAEAWDTQAFASAAPRMKGRPFTVVDLAASFSNADLALVGQAVLNSCDALDGLRDGIVGAFVQCTSPRIMPALNASQCTGAKTDQCLRPNQIAALERSMNGAHDRSGRPLYASFPWDAGLAAPGWRIWKIGNPAGPPALNVLLGAGSLASVFSTPPHPLSPDPAAKLAYHLAFDFDRDAPAIHATAPGFPRSAWQDIAMRSSGLSAFRAHGGRIIVPHGVSDPVFSINDSIAWWKEVDAATGGQAAQFARVFPVPGMNHCAGGPATDRFDAFGALVSWVEKGKAPDRIEASAGEQAPWPGRTRPLCPYPLIARPTGAGDSERAENFRCLPA